MYLLAYIRQIDWIAVIATVLTVIGLITDFQEKRKRKKREMEQAASHLEIAKTKADNENLLLIDYLVKENAKLKEELKRNTDVMEEFINGQFKKSDNSGSLKKDE